MKRDLRRELAVADPDYDAMHAAHMESLSAHLKATNCSVMTDDSLTKLTDVDVHVQHVFLPRRQGKEAAKAIIESENNKRNQQVKGTMAFLNRIIDELKRDATAPPQVMQITAKDRENRQAALPLGVMTGTTASCATHMWVWVSPVNAPAATQHQSDDQEGSRADRYLPCSRPM